MSGTVCLVTGASGYIASMLVKQLCEEGYKVRGTVRSLSDEEKVKHLTGLCPNNPVELFEADLMKDGSFKDAMAGVQILHHTASPFQLQVDDPQTQLIDPAVNGTKNVIGEAIAAGVKNIVLTASVASITDSKNFVPPEGYVFTEEDWNTFSTIENNPYPLSKTLAEKAAWDMVKAADGVSMKTIHPGLVIGPVLSARTDATSYKMVKNILECPDGKAAPACFGLVDVRDVCKAHIQASVRPEANGRYIVCSETSYPAIKVADMLRPKYGAEYALPTEGTIPPVIHQRSHAKSVKDLGLEYIPVEQAVNDMAESMISFGIVKKAAL